MIGIKNSLLIAFIAGLVILVFFRDTAIDAAVNTFPYWIFTIGAGFFLIYRQAGVRSELIGIAMVLSPIWMAPIVWFVIGSVTGMVV